MGNEEFFRKVRVAALTQGGALCVMPEAGEVEAFIVKRAGNNGCGL